MRTPARCRLPPAASLRCFGRIARAPSCGSSQSLSQPEPRPWIVAKGFLERDASCSGEDTARAFESSDESPEAGEFAGAAALHLDSDALTPRRDDVVDLVVAVAEVSDSGSPAVNNLLSD